MPDVSLLSALSIVTLVIVLVFGFIHLRKNRKEQAARGEKPGGMAGPST